MSLRLFQITCTVGTAGVEAHKDALSSKGGHCSCLLDATSQSDHCTVISNPDRSIGADVFIAQRRVLKLF
jgi:hypothetical protein